MEGAVTAGGALGVFGLLLPRLSGSQCFCPCAGAVTAVAARRYATQMRNRLDSSSI